MAKSIKLSVAVLVMLLAGCATDVKQSAQVAVGADLLTTTTGISLGLAAESNPFLQSPFALAASGVARLAAIHYVDNLPEPQRTKSLARMSAMTWGVAVSNAVVIASASNPAGFAAGVLAAWMIYKNTEHVRLEAANCAVAVSIDPSVVCDFN